MTSGGLESAVIIYWVAPLILEALATVLFLTEGLRERPSDRNVVRVVGMFRRRARRQSASPLVVLGRAERRNRLGAALLGALSLATLVLVVGLGLVSHRELAADEWVLFGLPPLGAGLVFCLGLAYVTFAYRVWAPQLLERVRIVLESESSTTNASGALNRTRP